MIDRWIGIDLGGTKIEVVALAGADGRRVVLRERVATPCPTKPGPAKPGPAKPGPAMGVRAEPSGTTPAFERAYAETLDAIAGLVERAERALCDDAGNQSGGWKVDRSPTPVGVGIPGSIDAATGLVKNANSTWLIGRRFGEDLARRLASPVRVSNDANCFALSEAIDGAGAEPEPSVAAHAAAGAQSEVNPARVVLGIILGTGVGSGIVVGGRILEGPNRIAGEWGHNPLANMTPDERAGAPRCYCGTTERPRFGCIETWCSGPALERDFARACPNYAGLRAREIALAAGACIRGGEPAPHTLCTPATDEARDGPEVPDDVALLASQAVDRLIDRLGRALAGVINILDPDVIVLGGGVGQIDRLYDPERGVLARARPWVFDASGQRATDGDGAGGVGGDGRLRTRVVPPRHGDSSGVLGAARLWDEPGPLRFAARA